MIIQGFYGDFPDFETQVLELHNQVFDWNKQESIKGVNGNYEDAYYFLYILDNKVIGMVTIAYNKQRNAYHVYNVCVHPLYQQRGISRQLERSVKQRFKKSLLFGLVKNDNLHAQSLFKRMGAKKNTNTFNDTHDIWYYKIK